MKYKVIFSKSFVVDADREINAERLARLYLEEDTNQYDVYIRKIKH